MKHKILSLVLLGLMCSVGNVWGTDYTIYQATSSGTSTANVTEDEVTVTFNKMKATSNSPVSTVANATYGIAAGLKAPRFGGGGDGNNIVVTIEDGYTATITAYVQVSKASQIVYIRQTTESGTALTTVSCASIGTVYEVKASKLAAGDYYIKSSSDQVGLIKLMVTVQATGPTITTQPVGASYVTGETISALTVAASASAGTLSYQWYSCDDAEKTNAAAISGATSASYTPTGAGFYFCRVTDSNGSIDTDVVAITVSAASTPTISIDSSKSSDITAGESITLTATVDGVPTPTIQWYYNTVNSTTAGTIITGETGESYTFDAIAGTKYYYAIATNSQGNTASNVITITAAARTGCILNQVVYSNGFDAFITDPVDETHGTITAYYLSGTSAPTISSTNKSDGATYTLEGSTFTLTSEDGATSKVYDVTLTAVEPYDEDGITFNGTESWVICPYGFSNANDRTGYKFQRLWKAADGAGKEWVRPKTGYTRIYMFMAPNTKVTLKSGCSSNRNINVFVNSNKVVDNETLAKNGGTIEVTGDSENAYLLGVYSNQSGGDGSIVSISVTGAQNTAGSETITPAKTYTTYVPQHDLDFTSANSLTAYIATAATSSEVTISSVDKVPAGTPIIIKATSTGSPITVNVAASTDDVAGNLLVMGDGATSIGGDKYDYILSNGAFYRAEAGTVAAGKAYLHLDADPAAGAPSLLRIVEAENNATAIEDIQSADEVVKFIENGQLLIKKNGVVYDALGRIVR